MSATYFDVLTHARTWINALSVLERPEVEHLRSAEAAHSGLARFVGPEVDRVLGELATEITAGQARALAARPDDPHYIPGWSGPRVEVKAPEPDQAIVDAIRAATDPPKVAHVSDVPTWTGWSGPVPVAPEESPADLADRVAADLDGAAELITALAADLGVPKDVGDASSVNIARACAAGAATLRLLAGWGDDNHAGERPASTGLGTEVHMLTELRATVERLEAELEESGEELADLARDREKSRDRAEQAENAAANLRPQVAVLRQQLHDAEDRANRLAGGPGARVALIAVLKALNTWAPGYDDLDTDELGAEAVKVASTVLADQQAAHASYQALVRELRGLPGMAGRPGPLVARMRAVLTEARITDLDQAQADRDHYLADRDRVKAELEATRAELAGARELVMINERVTSDLSDQVAGLETELAEARRRATQGVTIPPIQPRPGVTDLRPRATDGAEPPL